MLLDIALVIVGCFGFEITDPNPLPLYQVFNFLLLGLLQQDIVIGEFLGKSAIEVLALLLTALPLFGGKPGGPTPAPSVATRRGAGWVFFPALTDGFARQFCYLTR